jgi:hypothetical protein
MHAAAAAYDAEVRSTLQDKRLQAVMLQIDGAANREEVREASRNLCTQSHVGCSQLRCKHLARWGHNVRATHTHTHNVVAGQTPQALKQALHNPNFREFADKVNAMMGAPHTPVATPRHVTHRRQSL